MQEITEQVISLAEFSAHPRNYNRHPAEQVKRIRTSLRKFGQVKNVVVWRHYFVAGHGVAEAAKAEGWASLRANVLPEEWPEERVLAYMAADNELARLGDPDQAALAALLDDVFRFDEELLEAAGFSDDEFARLLAEVRGDEGGLLNEEGDEVDRAAELLRKWQVQPGQLWALGQHRLICGDCTDSAVVARLMAGERAALAPVDPPYNMGFDYDGRTVDDQKDAESYEQFTRAWFGLCRSVSERQIVTPGCFNLTAWLRWFDSFHVAPWTKINSMTNGKVTRFWCWEPVLFFGTGWARRRTHDVFDFPIGQQKDVGDHPCPKPLAMWGDLIENYSEADDVIYEAFSGSGTTIIACEKLGRRCRAAEISPAYVAVALERWSAATRRMPELAEALEVLNDEPPGGAAV